MTPRTQPPTAPAVVELGLRAAAATVDVEPDARALPTGRLLVDDAGKDALVAAGASTSSALSLLVAVGADASVRPARHGLVVLPAAAAGLGPTRRILGLAGSSHGYSSSSSATSRTR